MNKQIKKVPDFMELTVSGGKRKGKDKQTKKYIKLDEVRGVLRREGTGSSRVESCCRHVAGVTLMAKRTFGKSK